MSPPDIASIIHLAGFGIGIVLYAMLMLMTNRMSASAREGGEFGVFSGRKSTLMPFAVSVLGLTWNTIALVLFASRDFHLGAPSLWLAATGFAALGFLPAVVVHSAAGHGRSQVMSRWLVRAAYVLSAIGAVYQYRGALNGQVPSSAGLLTLTYGFALILIAWPIVTARVTTGKNQSLVVIALAAFAVSALHLSQPESATNSWGVELIGHHASLPLVLVILYQDYRFALVDLFLRRALSLFALVAVAIGLHVAFADPFSAAAPETLATTMRHIALLVVTALAYPHIRAGAGRFVDRVVLDRVNYAGVREQLNGLFQDAVTTSDLIDCATNSIALVFGARRVMVSMVEGDTDPRGNSRGSHMLLVPTVDAPQYVIQISDLAGGRRLLSDDHALLDWIAVSLARRIDAMRVANERHERGVREREILRLATEAELRALRAQLNPHFLFNALTTIGFLLQASPDRALQTLYKLTHLLRAVLRRSAGAFITLGEELELVESYLAIERERFEERLVVIIDVPDGLRSLRMPPLLLQPLVENAIKHGVAPLARGGSVLIRVRSDITVNEGRNVEWLNLSVVDTGAGVNSSAATSGDGIGLANIRARLASYYGNRAELHLTSNAEQGAHAKVRIPIEVPVASELSLKVAS